MDFKNLFYSYLASLIVVFSACQDKYLTAESIPLSLVTDKEALLSFKSQINMESPHPLSSWDVDSSPCNWTGVVCNKNLERVTRLDLSGLGLEEYGLAEKVTIAGDVYSYGILLLELFTGKCPVDESLKAGLSLKNWVEMSLPGKIEQVLDRELLSCMNNVGQEDRFVNTEIQVDCLITVIGVGLSCAIESPSERITIKDALHKLKSVKEILVKSTI